MFFSHVLHAEPSYFIEPTRGSRNILVGILSPRYPSKKIKVGYFLVFDLRTIFLVYLSIGNVLLNARQCQSLLEILLLDSIFTADLLLIYNTIDIRDNQPQIFSNCRLSFSYYKKIKYMEMHIT